MSTARQERRTQADRRTQSRNALLEAAAQGISQNGYNRLSLHDVSRRAGYSRGALYHQFAGKDELVRAVVEWVDQTWENDVGYVLNGDDDPAGQLVALARLHAIYCRRDSAAVLQILRIEFGGRDHPVAHALAATIGRTEQQIDRLIRTGRRAGTLPPGPPVADTREALLHAIEAVGIGLSRRAPHDVHLAERTARGVLGLPPT